MSRYYYRIIPLEADAYPINKIVEAVNVVSQADIDMLAEESYNNEGILQAHMLQVCPTIADGKISIKDQPFSWVTEKTLQDLYLQQRQFKNELLWDSVAFRKKRLALNSSQQNKRQIKRTACLGGVQP